MMNGIENRMKDKAPRIIAILYKDDWANINVWHFIVPEDIDLAVEERSWIKSRYMKHANHKQISFSEWLINRGCLKIDIKKFPMISCVRF
jgi:hypothetical protein